VSRFYPKLRMMAWQLMLWEETPWNLICKMSMVTRSLSQSHLHMLKPLQIKTLIANQVHSENHNGKPHKRLIGVLQGLQIKEENLSQWLRRSLCKDLTSHTRESKSKWKCKSLQSDVVHPPRDQDPPRTLSIGANQWSSWNRSQRS
jgi:hypothetical protein